MKKKLLYSFALVLALVLAAAAVYINSLMPIITGYAAKNLCSNVFVSEREPADVENTDLAFSFIKYTKNTVDFENRSVTSRFLWGKSKAVYRDGLGATLVRDVPEEVLLKAVYPDDTDPVMEKDTAAWPVGDLLPDTLIPGIDRDALAQVSDRLMKGNEYKGIPFAFVVDRKSVV